MVTELKSEQVTKPKIRHYSRQVLICTGPRCTEQGESEALFVTLQEKFRAAGIGVEAGDARVKRTRMGCVAACQGGPIVVVQPDGVWYYNVTDDNMDRIIQNHLKNGAVVEDLVFHRNDLSAGGISSSPLDSPTT